MALAEIRVNDISTTFTRPKNYIDAIVGGAVFSREKWNTPMGQVEHIAIGLYTDLVAYDESLRKIETMDCEVIPSHDFAVVRRHRFG